MKDYDIAALRPLLASDSATVVLFGAGDIGKLAHYALELLGIPVTCFCDNSALKQGKRCRGTMVISPEELATVPRNAHVFICGNYLASVSALLATMQFKNVYDCTALLDNIDFSRADFMQPLDIQRKIALHKVQCRTSGSRRENALVLKYIDVVVTEACSMKCRDCSNLMQYYSRPKHSDLAMLFDAIDTIMACIDGVYEFRVLGGEPFVNKQVHKVIDKLTGYHNVDKVIVYTNATIVPKGENLSCLKNSKVILDITNYGAHSVNYDKLIETLRANDIAYLTKIPTWTDSGTILHRDRSESELADMFMNCCVNDVLTLLNGRLYRCPFSANGTNLGAIPLNGEDVIDLTDRTKSQSSLRREIERLYTGKQYLTACSYCNGRDFRTPKIVPAIQVKVPLPLP